MLRFGLITKSYTKLYILKVVYQGWRAGVRVSEILIFLHRVEKKSFEDFANPTVVYQSHSLFFCI